MLQQLGEQFAQRVIRRGDGLFPGRAAAPAVICDPGAGS